MAYQNNYKSKPQLHSREELDARDGIVVIQLIFLVRHVIEQDEGRDLVVHLVVGTKAEVEDVFQFFRSPPYPIRPEITLNQGIATALVKQSRIESQFVVEVVGQFQLALVGLQLL